MRLLLVRHGETVDNVAGIYAGTTDSPLTTHGVLQASRLGAQLAATGVNISHIFSSDLQRAFKTAEAIRLAQPDALKGVTQLRLLREQDFGFYEGKHFYERPKGSDKSGRETHREAHMLVEGFRDVESKQSMAVRVETFLDGYLLPTLGQVGVEDAVAVIAHGIILTYLWRGILARFETGNVAVAAGVVAGGNGMGLEYLGGWSNTGYLELEVKSKVLPLCLPTSAVQTVTALKPTVSVESGTTLTPAAELVPKPSTLPAASSALEPIIIPSTTIAQEPPEPSFPEGSAIQQAQATTVELANSSAVPVISPKLLNMSLVVKAVNSQEHLTGLKKTRGGIGSLKHDDKQKTMDSFFKKRKLG